MRASESGYLEQAVGQSSHDWKAAQFELKKMRANHLTSDSDIRNTGFCAQRKRSRGAACQQPFIGRQALGRPMLAPFLDRLGIGAERLGKVLADTGYDKWMRIGNRHQCQRTRIGALPRVRRHEPRLRLDVVKIFNNRQRLEYAMTVMNKCRNHPLRVHRFISRLELVPGKNVDWNLLERQPLQPQRNPHPK